VVVLKGFRTFIMRGNVVDLAIAVVIGTAFGTVVKAAAADILTPLIAAIFGQPMQTHRGGTLGGRPDIHDCVARPGCGAGAVGMAGPKVHDRTVVQRDRHRSADLAPGGKVGRERILDARKARIELSVNFDIVSHW